MKKKELNETSLIFDARGNGGGKISPTITGDHQNRVTDYTAIVVVMTDERKDMLSGDWARMVEREPDCTDDSDKRRGAD